MIGRVKLRAAAIVLGAAIASVLLWFTALQSLDRHLYDVGLRLRASSPWPDDLVLVPITQSDVREHGRWPWPRDKTALLLQNLEALGAKTIIFDGVFEGATSPDPDAVLAGALTRAWLPVTYALDRDAKPARAVDDALLPIAVKGIKPLARGEILSSVEPFASHAAGMGHALSYPQPDDIVRTHSPLLPVYDGSLSLPSLALVAFLHQRGMDPRRLVFDGKALVFPDGRRIRMRGSEIALDFTPRDPARPATVSASTIMALHDASALMPVVQRKLALVYVDSELSGDRMATPLDTHTPGGLILATQIRTFANGRTPRLAPAWAVLLPLALLLGLLGPSTSRRAPRQILLGAAVAAALVVAGFVVLVRVADLFVPVLPPLLLLGIAGAAFAIDSDRAADRERTKLRELLAAARSMQPVEERGTLRLSEAAAEAAQPDAKSFDSSGVKPGERLAQPVRIGRYDVERCIGRGGMGAIFLAHDRDLGRDVAIKVLEAADRAAFTRFRQEALAVGRINHANVVQIYEVGFDEAVPYLVMEFVRGGTLSDLINDPEEEIPMEWKRSAKIIRAVAAGLGAAHAVGIVHRDMKPSNVLLADRKGFDAKVADFGIAKLAGGSALTREGTFLGTIGYLSPEQAMGLEVDPRSDVFSLGVAWYRILTGQLAWEGTTAEILRSSTRKPVPDPRLANPDCPAAVADLLAKMTALDREGRPANGDAVAAAIDSLLS